MYSEFDGPKHPRQRLRVGEPMIRTDLDQRRSWQAAVADQFLAIRERHHVVGPAVQDDGAGLHGRGRSPTLPRRAEQDEPCIAAVDVHRHGTAPARANDDLRAVLVELGLGDADSLGEVLVGQLRVDNLVAVVCR